MRLYLPAFIGTLLLASPAAAQLTIQKVTKVKTPYQAPTVRVEGAITLNKVVTLKSPGRRKLHAFVQGRTIRGTRDRVHLTTSKRGHALHFTLPTAALKNAGIQVDLPAVNLGDLPRGKTFRGSELASRLAQSQNKTVREVSTHDYAGMKAALEASKGLVIEAYTDIRDYNKDRRWKPTTNKSKRVRVPSVSEYSHRRGQLQGLVVTHVTDTKKSYENDRWLHQLFDPRSGQYTHAGSSTFKYPQTIQRAWVIE